MAAFQGYDRANGKFHKPSFGVQVCFWIPRKLDGPTNPTT